ncbi:MAG: glycosyltransferase family 9 protein [Pseudomonadota bacterium]
MVIIIKSLHYGLSRLHLTLKRGLMRWLGGLLRQRLVIQPAHWPEKVSGTLVMIDLCLGLGDILMISPAIRLLQDYGAVEVVTRWPRLLDADLAWQIARSWREQRERVAQWAAAGGIVLVPFTGLRGLIALLTWPGRLPPGMIVLDAETWLDTVSATLGRVEGSHYSDPPLAAAQALVQRLTGCDVPAGPVSRLPPLRIEPVTTVVIPSDPFVVLAPWASAATRRWPLSHWARLIDHLAGERPDLPLILMGSLAEQVHAETLLIQARRGHAVINWMGRLTLAETATLIARARLLLCCDSGPMHIGLGLDTPVVAIFGSTDPAARLYGHNAIAIADTTLCPHRLAPCYAGFQREPVCPTRIECLTGLSPERVATLVLQQLAIAPGNSECLVSSAY